MEDLARAVKLAAKYHMESYIEKKPIVVDGISIPNGEFTVNLLDAANRAAEEVGFDERGTMPVYLLLTSSWNDALDWANETLEESHD